MLSDLPLVVRKLREDTFAAVVARDRAEIQRQLRETGTYTIREGGQVFTISVPRPSDTRDGSPERTPR